MQHKKLPEINEDKNILLRLGEIREGQWRVSETDGGHFGADGRFLMASILSVIKTTTCFIKISPPRTCFYLNEGLTDAWGDL